MFCSNCGNQVADGLSFCPNCGTKLAAQPDIQPVIPQQPEPQAPIQQPPIQQAQAPIPQQPVIQPAAAAVAKKPINKKQIIKIGIIAGAAAVAIAAIIGVASLVSGGSSDKTLFNDGLVPFRSGENVGFLNKDGEIAITPQYYTASDFSDGLACVCIKGKDKAQFGYINKKGETVISPQYDYASSFKDGIAEVVIGEYAGFIDKKGKFIVDAQYKYEDIIYVGYNMFLIEDSSGDYWTLCDKKGKKINETRFDEPEDSNICPLFNEEWGSDKYKTDWKTIPLKMETGKYCYINNKGKTVLETPYDEAGYFCDGIASVGIGEYSSERKYGYINKKGEAIISPQYDEAGIFSEGLASVGVDMEYGYINKKGEYVVSPQYDYASAINNGVGIIREYSKRDDDYRYGIINKKGKVLCEPQYDDIDFCEDNKHILFESNDKYGYLDYKGKVVIPNEYKNATEFYSDGYAAVKVTDDKWTVINGKGDKIWNNFFDKVGS